MAVNRSCKQDVSGARDSRPFGLNAPAWSMAFYSSSLRDCVNGSLMMNGVEVVTSSGEHLERFFTAIIDKISPRNPTGIPSYYTIKYGLQKPIN